MLEGKLGHLTSTNHEHRLVGERIKDFLGEVDGNTSDRKLPLVHAGSFANKLANPQRRLKNEVEDWTDRLMLYSSTVRVANLAEYLTFTKNQALKTCRHPEQMTDGSLVMVANKMTGKRISPDPVELGQDISQTRHLRNQFRATCN